ncbi:MAG: polyprenyl synthetase family protein [Phycisphaerae bacterium]|nr:polyprenyl synthetase family protein [Phycisphaerae bacterium]
MIAGSEEEIVNALEGKGALVGEYLHNWFAVKSEMYVPLGDIIGHSLGESGLRIRPFLLFASYAAGGGASDSVLKIAGGIELIQISTLLVDDVLDDASTRNCAASVLCQWGPMQAVIAGIVLASAGLSIIAEGVDGDAFDSCAEKLKIVRLFNDTHRRIYVGQAMDLEFEGRLEVGEDKYFEMIGETTACFVQAPLVAGAMLWNGPAGLIEVLNRAGMDLGMAYQIRDDVLDIIGDPECIGKPRAGDIRQRKMRLPLIHALRKAEQADADKVRKLLKQPRSLNEDEVNVVLEVIDRAGGVEYAIQKTQEYAEKAIGASEELQSDYAALAQQLTAIAKLIGTFDDGDDGGVS